MRYVDLEELVWQLSDYDPAILDYYKSVHVGFSNGNTVDLGSDDERYVFKALAGRIYRTRNAVVHRKDSDRGRFRPFRDDQVLAKEIPLIRFVAEQVIINSSRLLT